MLMAYDEHSDRKRMSFGEAQARVEAARKREEHLHRSTFDPAAKGFLTLQSIARWHDYWSPLLAKITLVPVMTFGMVVTYGLIQMLMAGRTRGFRFDSDNVYLRSEAPFDYWLAIVFHTMGACLVWLIAIALARTAFPRHARRK